MLLQMPPKSPRAVNSSILDIATVQARTPKTPKMKKKVQPECLTTPKRLPTTPRPDTPIEDLLSTPTETSPSPTKISPTKRSQLSKAMSMITLSPQKKKSEEQDEYWPESPVRRLRRSLSNSLSRGRQKEKSDEQKERSRSKSRGRKSESSEKTRRSLSRGRDRTTRDRSRSRSRSRSRFGRRRRLKVRFDRAGEIHHVESFKEYQYLNDCEMSPDQAAQAPQTLLWWTRQELSDNRAAYKDLLSDEQVRQYVKSHHAVQNQVRKEPRVSAATWKKYLVLQEYRGMEVLDSKVQTQRKEAVQKIVSKVVANYKAMRRAVAEECGSQQKQSLLRRLLLQATTDGPVPSVDKLPKLSRDDADAVEEALAKHVQQMTASCRRWAMAMGKADCIATQGTKALHFVRPARAAEEDVTEVVADDSTSRSDDPPVGATAA